MLKRYTREYMDTSTLQQINDILGKNSSSGTSNGLFDINAILAPLMPFVIGLSVVSVLITILYLMNAITTYRSQRAILEMRKILREMNERDKARAADTVIPTPSAQTDVTQ